MPSSIEFKFNDEQMAEIKGYVEAKLEGVHERLEAAEALAGGVRSFLSSLPFQPPEAMGFQARVKLAGPLAAYEEVTSDAY